MRKLVSVSALLFVIMAWPLGALGATLSLLPSAQNISHGEIVPISLQISGLGNFTPPSLGAFGIEVSFDSTILSFESVNYDTFLGDPFDFFETDIVTMITPGTVFLDEISFLFDFELDALQPDTFTLATLTFMGSELGTTSLDFTFVDLSDALGNTIASPILEGSTVGVVPEPSTGILLASGLFVFLSWRWRKLANYMSDKHNM